MAPICSNCGANDFVWANDLRTGSIGRGTLSLRTRGELSLGTRICRACGHADLFLKDPAVLRQPHTWKPGEFVPIAPRHSPSRTAPASEPAPGPSHSPTPPPTDLPPSPAPPPLAPDIVPSPPAAPSAPPAPDLPPPPSSDAPPAPAEAPPAAESSGASKRSGRKRSGRSKGSDSG